MTYFDDIRSLLAIQGLSPSAKLVLIYLYDRQGGNGAAWPSITTISRECCISRQSVLNAIKSLEAAGLLKVKTAKRPSIKESNRYSVILTSLKFRPVDGDNQSKNLTRTSQKFRPEPVKNLDSNDSINESTNEPKAIFDNSRKIYPGRKRGLEVEFAAFKKAVKDWRDVLPLLEPAIRKYNAHCENLKATGQFCPNHKDFCRWLKNRCWEEEYPDPMEDAFGCTEEEAERFRKAGLL